MPEKRRYVHYMCYCTGGGDFLWCSIPIGPSRPCAVRVACNSWSSYAVITEVLLLMKIVVVKAPKSMAGILKRMFGINKE